MTGKTVSHYKIIEKLGDGGVYKARDLRLNRDVVVRFLPQQSAIKDEVWERFLINFQTLAALNHPYVTAIHAIEESQTLYEPVKNESIQSEMFIVMEFIKGRELKEIVQEKSPGLLDLQDVLYIAKRVASGLKSAHKRGIVHGGITSSNIWITTEGRVKIMNFGMAEVRALRTSQLVNDAWHRNAYTSPEQLLGKEVDYRADIWSFGIVLYEMLAGKLPFGGDNSAEIMDSIINEEPVPIHRLRPEVPIELELCVDALIRKNPEARPPDLSLIRKKSKEFLKADTNVVNNVTIHFHCPHCHTKYKASPEKSGQEVICKNCETIIDIPASRRRESSPFV